MTPELAQLYSLILSDGPKNEVDDGFDEYLNGRLKRQNFRQVYSYAIPTREAILDIINFAGGPIIEVMAGRGLWAKLINLEGGNIRATDYVEISDNRWLTGGTTWTNIELGDAREVAKTAPVDSTLMMIWPPYVEEAAGEALKMFTGNKFVYVGEREGGCTGGDNLFEELDTNWEFDHSVGIPTWYSIYDEVFCYRRKILS